ncbi:PAS domain S-box protein [Cellvibrio sp. UBA7661]|uniref:PAS domain S-box protein n=1 Tax=Cellvibrio sp. UBA7661 TaxID=1946311 RepID=UPI002F35364C
MIKAVLPRRENERLAYLHNLAILDTPREQSFDDLTQLAASICATPVALVSLIDAERQWFKSCMGLDGTETHRDLAFCAHAILEPDTLLVVEDTHQDPRFCDNPMVLGEPHIRFYAGAPLVTTDCLALGTLCVVDYQPRQLDQAQIQALKLLAGQVMQLLQLREANNTLGQERRIAQEREDRLQSMVSNFPGAVYRCENNSRWSMLFMSAAVESLTGYPAKDFLGDDALSMTDITHSDDVPVIYELVQEALAQHRSFHLIYRLQHADQSWRWVEEVGCGVFDEQGEIRFIDGFIWDITTAEVTRKEIALSEQKLSTLYTQAPVGIILNDLSDGRFLDCNPEFPRLTGYSVDEILTMTYVDLTPPEYQESDKRELQNLVESGRYGPYEKHYIHKNGQLIPVLLNGVLTETPTGEQHIWTFIQDITERKRIEQMKNEFVSAVSHELRTPLTAISGSLGLIASGMLGDLPSTIRNMVDIAHKNSLRLTLLINDLLDMEKILAGKMEFNMKEQALLPILENSLESNKAYADTFGIRLELRTPAADLRVRVDAQRLQQVLANFISNAVKFSPSGGQVELELSQQGEWARIAVVDHGPGISEEFRARIFQKFSQADSSDSRQRGGTGLGLAISKSFVEKMQGKIGFESELGKGAAFFALFLIAGERLSSHQKVLPATHS